MDWKFWERSRDLKELRQVTNDLGEKVTNIGLQITEMVEQMNILARLQYKSSQYIHGKLERMNASVDKVMQEQAVFRKRFTATLRL